jgi:hypothetical protein
MMYVDQEMIVRIKKTVCFIIQHLQVSQMEKKEILVSLSLKFSANLEVIVENLHKESVLSSMLLMR